MTELEKYKGIYSSPERYSTYGHSNHGKGAVPILAKWKPYSLVDVGCGFNEFAKNARVTLGIDARGVDFACPGADIIASSESLPFTDKQFDTLTAFDMLEHLAPESVVPSLKEFARVSTRFIFSIAYQPSVIKWQGHNLHPTVQPEDWWILKIIQAGGTHIAKEGRYITGKWCKTLPIPSSCVLVGNGPSALRGNHGPEIDAFDEIVRFNAFNTLGFEAHTGSRTTLWSTFGKGVVPANDVKPDRAIYIHGEIGEPSIKVRDVYLIPRYVFNHITDIVKKRSGNPESKLIPSSGTLVSWWLLNVVGVTQLSLIGFDHFKKSSSRQHHYWDPKEWGRPKEHDGDIEAAIFAEWNESGRVRYLESH